MILHLVTRAEWEAADASKPWLPKAYAADGFIHCTAGDALMLSVANRFYRDAQGDVWALSIDETKVTSPVKWEAPSHPARVPPSAVAPPMPAPLQHPDRAHDVRARAHDMRARDFDDAHIAAHLGRPAAPVEPLPVETAPPPVAAPPAPPPEPEVLFPHIYGPLNRDAITGVRVLLRDAAGKYVGYGPVATAVAPPAAPPTDPLNPLNLKRPSEMAQELLDATDGVSEAMKRMKDRIEGRMSEIDEKIKKL
jgi:uncharacterized protein (DUF952 family)